MDTDSTFSVTDFINNRWNDAREALAKLDSAFVKALEVFDGVAGKGLVAPIPTNPTKRLPQPWYSLLESTVDISQHLNRTDRTLERLESNPTDQDRTYYMSNWVKDAWSLAEKTDKMVSFSCKLYQLGKKRRTQYAARINKTKDHMGTVRHPIEHGAGGVGVNARAITDEGLWELGVVVGPDILRSYFSSPTVSPELVLGARPTTKVLLEQLGSILSDLEQDLQLTKNRQAQ